MQPQTGSRLACWSEAHGIEMAERMLRVALINKVLETRLNGIKR